MKRVTINGGVIYDEMLKEKDKGDDSIIFSTTEGHEINIKDYLNRSKEEEFLKNCKNLLKFFLLVMKIN